MKSRNVNLKSECRKCSQAQERKRRRLEREHEDETSGPDEENNNEAAEDSESCDEDEEDLINEAEGKKRKRSGEKHSHCHCPLFQVTEDLLNFMSGGQPYHRFKSDQLKRRDAGKVNKVLLIQNRKQDKAKFVTDLKKELVRFKQSLRLVEKQKKSEEAQPKTTEEKKEERRLRKEELEKKRKAVKENLPLLFD